jgi:tripartite-type tricarboxylate transporter receptor subunit TctC
VNASGKNALVVTLKVLLVSHATPSFSQTFPSQTVRWILGFPAGGSSDILARTVGLKLTELWGQAVVVDNRPGASGVIANVAVAKAPADGYTLLLMSSTFANLIATGRKTPYDPFGDLEPVAQLAAVPNVVSVHPSLPVKSVKELIAVAKSRPGQINYGTGGTLTGPHLATELFKLITKIDMTHVAYKGTPPAVIDLVAGRLQLMMALTPVVMPHLKAHRLRPIAVTSARRIPDLPDVPAVADTVAGYEASSWYGVMMPKNTPRAVVAKVNGDIGKVLAMPDVVQRLADAGFQVTFSTPEGLARFIRKEADIWKRVITEAKIPVD